MAIQTRGFGVDVMPRYTGIDPILSGYNPSSIPDGVLSAFKIKDTLDKMKAFKALQDELEATRAGRIASQNAAAGRSTATDTAFTPLAGLEARTRQAQLDQLNTLFPHQTSSMVAGLNLSEQKALADQGLLPGQTALSGATTAANLRALEPETEARIASANKTTGLAGLDLALLPQTGAVRAAENAGKLGTLADEANLRPDIFKLTQKKTQDAFTSFDVDKAREDALKDARIAQAKAEAAQALAHAEYFKTGGVPKRGFDPATQIAALARAAKAIEDEYRIPAYEAATYDENGKPRTNMIMPNPKKDPAIESAIKERNQYRSAINTILKGWAGSVMNEVSTTEAPQTKAGADNGATKTGAEGLPVLTPEQAAKAAPGTPFIGTDGKKRVVAPKP